MPTTTSRPPVTDARRPSKAEMRQRVAGHRRRPYRQPKHSPMRLALLLLGCFALMAAATVAGIAAATS